MPCPPTSTDSHADDIAHRLRGFGPVGILAVLVIFAGNAVVVPLSAVLGLVWARLSRTPWREIGYVRPQSWTRTLIVGIVFGVAFKFLMKAIVMPLLGAPPINQAYHFLAGNTAALPWMLYAVIVGAGFGEETVFRGWMFERFGKLFGSSVWAKTLRQIQRITRQRSQPGGLCASHFNSVLCMTVMNHVPTSLVMTKFNNPFLRGRS